MCRLPWSRGAQAELLSQASREDGCLRGPRRQSDLQAKRPHRQSPMAQERQVPRGRKVQLHQIRSGEGILNCVLTYCISTFLLKIFDKSDWTPASRCPSSQFEKLIWVGSVDVYVHGWIIVHDKETSKFASHSDLRFPNDTIKANNKCCEELFALPKKII